MAAAFPDCASLGPNELSVGFDTVIVGHIVPLTPARCREYAYGQREDDDVRCGPECRWIYVLRPLNTEERFTLDGVGSLAIWGYKCELKTATFPGVYRVTGGIRPRSDHLPNIRVREMCRLRDE